MPVQAPTRGHPFYTVIPRNRLVSSCNAAYRQTRQYFSYMITISKNITKGNHIMCSLERPLTFPFYLLFRFVYVSFSIVRVPLTLMFEIRGGGYFRCHSTIQSLHTCPVALPSQVDFSSCVQTGDSTWAFGP